jgi:hypothetical protein
MRALLLATLALSACGREPESTPSGTPAVPSPPLDPAERPIAFVRQGNLWVMKADGTGARALTDLKDAAVASPAWSPDRRQVAFSASVDPDFQLTPRNLFVIGADGTGLRQVTPMIRAGRRLDDAPKGIVRGRASRIIDGQRVPAPGLRVTAYGTHQASETAADGSFQVFLPAGGGWIRIAGMIDDRRWGASRFTAVSEGSTTLLGEITVSPGGDSEPALPAWGGDGRSIGYLSRHSLINRLQFGGTVSLHLIREDGSGDQTIAEPAGVSIIAGPVLQGGTSWFKTSDGRILRVDLDTRQISAAIDVGTGVPDALALAPDGATFATLRLESAGLLEVALVRGGKAIPLVTLQPGGGVPHAIDFSPDGTTLVMDRRDGARSDVWSLRIATKAWTRLTSDGQSSDPVWHGK